MKLTEKLYAMFLVCLGDLASALIIVPVLIYTMDYHATATLLIFAVGLVASVILDSDILFYKLLKSNKPEDIAKHRDLLHKPLFIIPIFFMLYIFSPFWAWLVSLCLLAHFMHDSTGSGYGVKWFQPFSQNTYKFCWQHIICIWTPEYVAEHPWSPTLDEWLEEYYLKWTPESFAGIVLLFIAVIVNIIVYAFL